MANCNPTADALQFSPVKYFVDEPEPGHALKTVAIGGNDACRLLSAMLERIKAELRQGDGVFVSPNTEKGTIVSNGSVFHGCEAGRWLPPGQRPARAGDLLGGGPSCSGDRPIQCKPKSRPGQFTNRRHEPAVNRPGRAACVKFAFKVRSARLDLDASVMRSQFQFLAAGSQLAFEPGAA